MTLLDHCKYLTGRRLFRANRAHMKYQPCIPSQLIEEGCIQNVRKKMKSPTNKTFLIIH
jgi:hypothetical protein